MIIVQPDVKGTLRQIGCILGHQTRVVMLRVSQENPAHMSPPRAVTRRVRITGLIGFLVMDPMRRNPEDRSSLERQRPTNGKEILQAEWYLVRSVRVQAMVPHADTKTCGHPDEESGDRDPVPVEHE